MALNITGGVFNVGASVKATKEENRIKSTSNKQYDRKANAIFSMEGTYKKGGKININLSLINVIKLHSVKLNYKYDNKLIRVDKIIVDSNISVVETAYSFFDLIVQVL